MGLRDQAEELLNRKDVRKEVPVIGLYVLQCLFPSPTGLLSLGTSSSLCFDPTPSLYSRFSTLSLLLLFSLSLSCSLLSTAFLSLRYSLFSLYSLFSHSCWLYPYSVSHSFALSLSLSPCLQPPQSLTKERLDLVRENGSSANSGLVVMGDSSCFDDSPRTTSCIFLMEDFLTFAQTGEISQRLSTRSSKLSSPHDSKSVLPQRMEGTELFDVHSKVRGPKAQWYASCPAVDFSSATPAPNGDPVEITWEPRVFVSRDRRRDANTNQDGVVQLLEGMLLVCSDYGQP